MHAVRSARTYALKADKLTVPWRAVHATGARAAYDKQVRAQGAKRFLHASCCTYDRDPARASLVHAHGHGRPHRVHRVFNT